MTTTATASVKTANHTTSVRDTPNWIAAPPPTASTKSTNTSDATGAGPPRRRPMASNSMEDSTSQHIEMIKAEMSTISLSGLQTHGALREIGCQERQHSATQHNGYNTLAERRQQAYALDGCLGGKRRAAIQPTMAISPATRADAEPREAYRGS